MIKLQRSSDHGYFEASEMRCAYCGPMPGVWHDHSLFLQLAGRIQWDGRVVDFAVEGTGASFVAPMVRATMARANKHLKKMFSEKSLQKGALGKRGRPSQRNEMAHRTVQYKSSNIRFEYWMFSVSKACDLQ